MLTIEIPDLELFNNKTSEFIYFKATTLKFENSLVSISKWEQKWHVPFPCYQSKAIAEINNIQFTEENFVDYLRCMCVNQNVDPELFKYLPKEALLKIKTYMEDPMTATKVNHIQSTQHKEKIVTNELVYFWMVSYQIPIEPCHKWHINRLLTLINVAAIENAPKKKMTAAQTAEKYRAINAARRKKKPR